MIMNWIELGLAKKGSAKSGNYGHAGRPGRRGGSAPKKVGGGTSVMLYSEKWEYANDLREEIDDHIIEAEQYGMTMYQSAEQVSDFSGESHDDCLSVIETWAETSNDRDIDALTLQKNAAEEFGVEMSEFSQNRLDAVMEQQFTTARGSIIRPSQTVSDESQKQILRTMHSNTQNELRIMGIEADDKVMLYRGVSLSITELQEKTGDTRVQPNSEIKISDNAISSWTTEYGQAMDFAEGSAYGGKLGVVLETAVPAKNILSFGTTGLGTLGEREVVVLGAGGIGRLANVYDPERGQFMTY